MVRVAEASVAQAQEAIAQTRVSLVAELYQETTVQLERGDTCLLYTDGITEAQGKSADQFGVVRLRRMFGEGAIRPAELVDQLRQAVRVHEQGQAAEDDQTLVVVRVL